MTGKQNTWPSVFSVFRCGSLSSPWVGELISGVGSTLSAIASPILIFLIRSLVSLNALARQEVHSRLQGMGIYCGNDARMHRE
jgi:fumarate reductase subunit D